MSFTPAAWSSSSGRTRANAARPASRTSMELVSAAKSFEPDPADEMSPLDEFLSHAALEAGEGQADAWEDCVAAHDDALGEGPGVPARVPVRHGRRPVSAPALDCRSARPRGRTAALLRRHHAREANPVRYLCGAAPPARHGQFFASPRASLPKSPTSSSRRYGPACRCQRPLRSRHAPRGRSRTGSPRTPRSACDSASASATRNSAMA